MRLKNLLNNIHDNNHIISISFFGLLLLCLISLIYFKSLPMKSVMDSVVITGDSDTIISDKSGLGFKNVTFDGNNIALLSYLTDETLNIDKDGEFIQSINIGKLCISISGSYLNVNSTVTTGVLKDLLTKLCSEFNQNDVELIKENIKTDIPYKITKDKEHIFIDFISYVPNNRKIAIYYRVIVQDVRTINDEISETEYNILPDSNLNEILELLGIDDTSFLDEYLQEIGEVKNISEGAFIEGENSTENTINSVDDNNGTNDSIDNSVETDVELEKTEEDSEPIA